MQNIKGGGVVSVIKGVFFSLIIVLVGVLIFAGVIKLTSLSSSAIKPVNQFIKVLAIFFGCFLSVRGSLGFLKGGFVGVLGTALIYLTFSLIGGEISFGMPFIIDLVFGLIVGIISGIITVNVKKD